MNLKIKWINEEIVKLYNNKNIKNLFWINKLLTPWFYSKKLFDFDADILFVGMNPAWTLKNFDSWDKEDKGVTKNDKINSIINENNYKESESPYKYYKWFIDLFPKEKENYNWNHIDLFQYRCTNQKELEKIIYDEKYNDFIEKQFKIFENFIITLNPKIIVISNATASRYLKLKWFDSEKENIWEDWYWETPF